MITPPTTGPSGRITMPRFPGWRRGFLLKAPQSSTKQATSGGSLARLLLLD